MRQLANPMFLIFLALMLFNSVRTGDFFNDPATWFMDKLVIIPGVIIGISFHEFAHGWVAYKLGDPTPKLQNRVTINPAAHVDPIGFIALLLAGFGWGRPVEINPNNFKKRRRDEFLVSIAGVTMNLILAVIFGFIMKIVLLTVGPDFIYGTVGGIIWQMLMYTIMMNLVLMIFNLIPVPPLDGFSIISEIFNIKHTNLYYTIYNNGFFILMILILFGGTSLIISPAVEFLLGLITNHIIF